MSPLIDYTENISTIIAVNILFVANREGKMKGSHCVLLLSTLLFITAVSTLEPCPGDTRGDKRCNFDDTHRVCAKIGVPNTSFWKFTGQQSWCQTTGIT